MNISNSHHSGIIHAQITRKILVVDDDDAISESIQVILEGEGYTVGIHNDGKGVYSKIEEYIPDLIVLDYWLPGDEDGGEIAKKLKGNSTTSHIPIIMISASNNAEKKAYEKGANDFLSKPFDIDELLQVVKKYLS